MKKGVATTAQAVRRQFALEVVAARILFAALVAAQAVMHNIFITAALCVHATQFVSTGLLCEIQEATAREQTTEKGQPSSLDTIRAAFTTVAKSPIDAHAPPHLSPGQSPQDLHTVT